MKKFLVFLMTVVLLISASGAVYAAETRGLVVKWSDNPFITIRYVDGKGVERETTRDGRGIIVFGIPENVFIGSAITVRLDVGTLNDQEYGVRLTVPAEFEIIPVTSLLVEHAGRGDYEKNKFLPPLQFLEDNIICIAVSSVPYQCTVSGRERFGRKSKTTSFVLEPSKTGEFTLLAEILKNGIVQKYKEVIVEVLPVPEGKTVSWERSAVFGEERLQLGVEFNKNLPEAEQTTETAQEILNANIYGTPSVTFKSEGNFTLTNEGTFPLDLTLREPTTTTIEKLEGEFLEGWITVDPNINRTRAESYKGVATESFSGSLHPTVEITNIQNLGRVFGYVRNCADRPVGGVEVRLGEEVVYTNPRGFYEFTEVALGRQEIQIIPPEGEITKIEVMVQGEQVVEGTQAEILLSAETLEQQADFVVHGAVAPPGFPWIPIVVGVLTIFLLLLLRRKKKQEIEEQEED